MSRTLAHQRSTSCPPPTLNALSPGEKQRMIRSTRKIRNLLGETPHFPEALFERPRASQCLGRASHDSAPPRMERPRHRNREAVVLGASPQVIALDSPRCSAQASIKGSSSRTPPISRPLLLLRVQSHETTHAPVLLDPTLVNPGPSFSALVASHPLLAFAVASRSTDTIHRERRRNKASRVMGEPIPPDLRDRVITEKTFPEIRSEQSRTRVGSEASLFPPFSNRVAPRTPSPVSFTSPAPSICSPRTPPASSFIHHRNASFNTLSPAPASPQRNGINWSGEWSDNMDVVARRLRELR